MKIGILTLCQKSNMNYGAVLQAWALKTVIERIVPGGGIFVLPLEKHPREEAYKKYKKKSGLINWIRFRFSVLRRMHVYRIGPERINETRFEKFQLFLRKYAFEGRDYFFAKDIEYVVNDIDVIVIGSDWVWYVQDSELNDIPQNLLEIKSVYLGFCPSQLRVGQKRIAYAASQGIIPNQASSLWRLALNNFSAVSVREVESVKYFTENGSPLRIEHVLDPTLLLESEDLQEIEVTVPTEMSLGHYIVLYILPSEHTQEIIDYVRDLSEKIGMPIRNVSWSKDVEIPDIEALGGDLGPSEFLTYIKNSKYVVTNSFHGMVFASLYHRRFTAFQRQANDFRQINLVRLLGLENRLLPTDGFKTYSELKDPFDIEVDWTRVDERRRKEAQHSVSFLKRSILDGNTAH